MQSDINILINNIKLKNKYQKMKKIIISLLSCLVVLITIYKMILPAVTQSTDKAYKLYLKDTYINGDYTWKIDNGYKTEYELNLYFEDTLGNSILGRDVVIDIGPNTLTDVPYGFGVTPLENESVRGGNIIALLDLEEYALETGEKYIFDHAEVYVDGVWRTFSNINSNYWHIWCQSSSSKSSTTNYGWRGNYGESTRYTITEDTEYKFVYKLVRLGTNNLVESLDNEAGISFNIFNYTGDNAETGVNANGLYDYFSFRGIGNVSDKNINSTLDADGFTEYRAKVLPKLDNNGYPVFDCGVVCDNDSSLTNTSLGYLFGASTNAKGMETIGVTSYNPTNTILQKEILDGVEYYYYDSNRNAVDYDSENNKFMLRDYVERSYTMTTYENEADRYEFLPFNYLTDTKNTYINSTNNRAYNYEVDNLDHWYGMTMEFTFYMPSNGEINGKDMVFEFSGDDDVWVFIDDVLVLDLGGTHGAVDGSINFKTGHVEGYLNWNGTEGEKNITNIYEAFSKASMTDSVEWNNDKTTLANYTKHTLKFFYLERGATVANCKIRFNMPVLPNGSLSVQKQFVGANNYNDDYVFRLYDVTTDMPSANTEYTIDQDKFTTNEYGEFTLKNTEIAVFKLINEHKYYIEEINTGPHAISYSCSLDGTPCPKTNKTVEVTINPDSAYLAVFTNKIKTYNLKVTKFVYDSEDNKAFNFKLILRDKNTSVVDIPDNQDGTTNYTVNHESGIVSFNLANEESIIIKEIPLDTIITLKEVNHDGYQTVIKSGDTVLTNGYTYEFVMNSDQEITVYNNPGIVLPNTGGIGKWYYLIIGSIFILIGLNFRYIFNLKGG